MKVAVGSISHTIPDEEGCGRPVRSPGRSNRAGLGLGVLVVVGGSGSGK